MKLVIGSDHAGFQLKVAIGDLLRSLGHEVLDVGAFNENPSDYPDFAEAVGRAVVDKRAERGVLICGSGVGASVAANKIPGIRAGMCHDTYSAHQGVEHDDINILVLGSRVVGVMLAESDGSDPRRFLGPGPFLVHPHSLRWYTERLALGRMREHFGMLDA